MYGNLSHFFNIFQIIFIFIIIIHFLDRVAVREFILLSSVTGCPSVCLVWVLSHHHRQHHRQPLSPILQRLTKFFFLFPRQGDERETERHTQREKKRNHNNNNTHLIAKTGDNFK